MSDSRPDARPLQAEDRVPARAAVLLMVVSALIVLAGIAGPCWLMPAEQRRGRPSPAAGLAPAPGERVPERRVGGLLLTPIEPVEGRAEPERRDSPPDSWGWVDPKRGLVRMPIDRAIELVLERYGEEASR